MIDSDTIRKEFTKELKVLLDKYDAELEYESVGEFDHRKDRLKFYCPSKWLEDELVQDFTTFDVLCELNWL